MEMTYRMTIAGCERELPLCRGERYAVHRRVYHVWRCGDHQGLRAGTAQTRARARRDDHGGGQGHSASVRDGGAGRENRYLVARKAPKVYMRDVVSTEVRSITTQAQQTLYLSGEDAQYLQGKRVLIVDDVVSTGESIAALERLVVQLGGEIAGRMTVLAEGEAQNRGDIIYLEKLPTFHPDGTVMA